MKTNDNMDAKNVPNKRMDFSFIPTIEMIGQYIIQGTHFCRVLRGSFSGV